MSGWDENLLNAYLDGELDGKQALEVERLLASDPAARQEFGRLSYVVGLVRAAARKGLTEPPPHLVETIARFGETRPSRRQIVGWALAASVAGLGVGAAGAYAGYNAARRMAEEEIVLAVANATARNELDTWLSGVADYVRLYADDQRHLVEYEADRKNYIESYFGEKLGRTLRVPELPRGGLKFRGGRLLAVGGQAVAQFVYLPDTGRPICICVTRTQRADQAPQIAARGDLSLLHWNGNGSAYVIAGWADEATLRMVWGEARQQLSIPR